MSDNVYGRGKKKAEMIRRRPGVSPVAIGKYLLDKTVFIRLADVIDGLPPYEENVLSYTMEKKTGRGIRRFSGTLETGRESLQRRHSDRCCRPFSPTPIPGPIPRTHSNPGQGGG